MGMVEAIKSFFSRYTDFTGRSRRAEYWWSYLALILIYLAIMLVGAALSAIAEPLVYVAMIAYYIFALAVIIPSIAIGIRRLHDTNRTGWWLLIGLVPLVGPIVLLIFFVLPGTVGPNTFGPDPKGGIDTGTFD